MNNSYATGGTVLERVLVVGAGLIGTSIALALRQCGLAVELADRDPAAVQQAVRRGAGRPVTGRIDVFDLAVIAVPPSSVVEVLQAAQRMVLAHCYTDVCSVKAPIVAQARQRGCDLSTFVPGHPLAGSHESGPFAAKADLFLGRCWALCVDDANNHAVDAASEMVRMTGASPYIIDPCSHDSAVALSSHAPHIVSSVLAAMFEGADPVPLRLAGRGVFDATRIAGGPAELWTDILIHNSSAVAGVLDAVARRISIVAAHLHQVAGGAPAELARPIREVLEEGNRGRELLLENFAQTTSPIRWSPTPIPSAENRRQRDQTWDAPARSDIGNVHLSNLDHTVIRTVNRSPKNDHAPTE